MTTITLQVPDQLEMEPDETVQFLAAKLYESGKLTLGRAAEMVGMKKWDFAEILINYDVHFFEPALRDDLKRMKDEQKI
jgi:predicted HTH domain antitoxin